MRSRVGSTPILFRLHVEAVERHASSTHRLPGASTFPTERRSASGLAYNLYPYVVIDQLTVWQAAGSPAALKVILVGVCISVPAIVWYTAFSYRVFRGKTGALTYA